MKSIIAGVLLFLCSLITQGQVLSFGLEINRYFIRGNKVTANDTITFIPETSIDPRFTFVSNVELRISNKSSIDIGLTGSTFFSVTQIWANVSNSLFPLVDIKRYQYFDLGLPILLKYSIWKNLRIIGGINVNQLIGKNKNSSFANNFPSGIRESFAFYEDAIEDQFNRTYLLGRYGLEIGLFKGRYIFYMIAQRSITNPGKNQNQAFPTPTSYSFQSIGIGLQYRLRGKLE